MLVGNRMSHPVITLSPDMPISEAHELLNLEKIRRAPVVQDGKLVGIISDSDLLKASPSPVTSLSIFEINYLLQRICVKDVMTKKVITVQEDTPIEDAARLMADQKVGGLPVMRGNELVGIITQTDLFKIMLEMMGARHPGVRFTVLMPFVPGEIAKLSQAVFAEGGNITALSTFAGESPSNFMMTLKVEGVPEERIKAVVEPLVLKLLSIRTS